MTGVEPEVWIETASSPAVYYPGSVIKGNVVMESSITPIQVKVNLSGIVYTHWKQLIRTGRRRVREISCGHSKTILNVRLNNILPSTHNGVTSTQSTGTVYHRLPFTIRLPDNVRLPTSFEYTDLPPVRSDLRGYIRYLLTATISVTSRSYTAVKGITIISNIDVNTPRLLRPLSSSNEKTICFGCVSGLASLTISTDRGAYCSGESICIKVDAESYGLRAVEIRASLKQLTVFWGNRDYRSRQTYHYEVSKVIKTIKSSVDSQNMSLPIPITIPTITECSSIQMLYALDVVLVLRNERDLHVLLPIVIGTIPFRDPNSLDSTGQLPSTTALERSNLKYAPISTKQVYLGLDAHIQGNLYYTPLYGYIENEVADSHST